MYCCVCSGYVGSKDLKRFCSKVLVSLLSSLPSNYEDLLTTYTQFSLPQEFPSTFHPQNTPSPISIVLYVLCSNPLITSSSMKGVDKKVNPTALNAKNLQQSFQVLLAFSEMLSSEDIPEAVREMIVLQVCNWHVHIHVVSIHMACGMCM